MPLVFTKAAALSSGIHQLVLTIKKLSGCFKCELTASFLFQGLVELIWRWVATVMGQLPYVFTYVGLQLDLGYCLCSKRGVEVSIAQELFYI
jgi:hypothetical protein